MKKYWAVVKLTLQEYFVYRLSFFLEISGGFILMLATIALWYAIFKISGNAEIGDYTLPEMITYLLGAGIISSSLWLSGQGDEINDDINYGWISQLLAKPMNVPTYWFMRDVSQRLLTFFFKYWNSNHYFIIV
jgi:ABC-2 type transport system permease protein